MSFLGGFGVVNFARLDIRYSATTEKLMIFRGDCCDQLLNVCSLGFGKRQQLEARSAFFRFTACGVRLLPDSSFAVRLKPNKEYSVL